MALVLVLIVFGVGSLTIVPFLDYARTSLQDPTTSSSSASSSPLYDQYAADAGAQFVFWQLDPNLHCGDAEPADCEWLAPALGISTWEPQTQA